MAVRDPTWPYPIWFQNLSSQGPGENPRGIRVPVCWEGWMTVFAVPGCQLGGMCLLVARPHLWWLALTSAVFGTGLMFFAMAVRTDYRSLSDRSNARGAYEASHNTSITD